MNLTLAPGTTTFRTTARGLLIWIADPHSNTYVLVPKVGSTRVTFLGKNTTVKLGGRLTLTMPTTMWAEHEDAILTAAIGARE